MKRFILVGGLSVVAATMGITSCDWSGGSDGAFNSSRGGMDINISGNYRGILSGNKAVAKLREAYPKVNVSLHQGSPDQVARMVLDEVAEIGMATESLADYGDLVTLPCYEWQHVLVLPPEHPLVQKERLSLEDIANEPLITYHPSFTGRTRIDQAFAAKKLQPRIALEAIDSDVIKTYVRLGLGVGIVAEMAVRDDPIGDLAVRPMGHLFGQNVARVAFKRGAYLRNFVYKFAELLSDRLSRELIAKALSGHVNDYEL